MIALSAVVMEQGVKRTKEDSNRNSSIHDTWLLWVIECHVYLAELVLLEYVLKKTRFLHTSPITFWKMYYFRFCFSTVMVVLYRNVLQYVVMLYNKILLFMVMLKRIVLKQWIMQTGYLLCNMQGPFTSYQILCWKDLFR